MRKEQREVKKIKRKRKKLLQHNHSFCLNLRQESQQIPSEQIEKEGSDSAKKINANAKKFSTSFNKCQPEMKLSSTMKQIDLSQMI